MVLKKLLSSGLFRSTSVYMLFNVLQSLVPFLVLPILTRKFPEELMGFYVTYQSIYNLAVPLVTQSLDSAVTINYFHITLDRFKKYCSTSILTFLAISFAILLIVIVFSDYITKWLDFDILVFYLMFITICFNFFNRLVLSIFQVRRQAAYFGLLSLTSIVISNGILLYLTFCTENINWIDVVISPVIGQGIAALFSVFFLLQKKYFTIVVVRGYVYDLLKIGSPLSLHQIGAWAGNVGARLVVSSALGYLAVAQFGVGVTFGTIMIIIQDSFNKAFTPYMFGILKKISENKEEAFGQKIHIVKFTYIYNLSLILIGLVVSISGWVSIGWIFGDNYNSARIFIPWAVFAAVFNGMYKMHIVYLFFNKRTFEIAKITILTGVINIILCYLLITIFNSSIGASVSLLFTQIVAYFYAWKKGQDVFALPWFKKNL